MRKVIKTENLVGALGKLGFERRDGAGSHAIFREKKTGVVVTVPMSRKELPQVYNRAIVGQIIRSGIVSAKDFDAMLK